MFSAWPKYLTGFLFVQSICQVWRCLALKCPVRLDFKIANFCRNGRNQLCIGWTFSFLCRSVQALRPKETQSKSLCENKSFLTGPKLPYVTFNSTYRNWHIFEPCTAHTFISHHICNGRFGAVGRPAHSFRWINVRWRGVLLSAGENIFILNKIYLFETKIHFFPDDLTFTLDTSSHFCLILIHLIWHRSAALYRIFS